MNARWVRLAGALGFAVAALLGWGCAGGGTEVGNPALTPDQQLEAYIKEQLATNLLPSASGAELGAPVAGAPPAAPGAIGDSAGEGRGFSGTNLQEAGVDESDVVKTDGRFLYVAGSQAVNVVEENADGTLSARSRIDVKGQVDSLYLRGNTLVVLYTPVGAGGRYWTGLPMPDVLVGMPYWLPMEAKTGLLLVDVQDPANPAPLREWSFEGHLVSSRLIGAKLHLVQQFFPELPPLDLRYWDEGSRASAIRANRQRLQSVPLDELIPSFTAFDGSGNQIAQGRLVAAEEFVQPAAPEGGTIVSVVTVDLDQPQAGHQAVGAILDAHHVYASPQTLYLASQRYEPSTSADVFSPGETRTAVHAFDLAGEKVTYRGKGEVPGTALNQFSFGEYEGVLRVAVTTGSVFGWGASSRNHVYCLQAGPEGLQTIGKLEDLAPGERIYSARFLGKRGFLVTFVQVDPLFTLDLSDPTAPRVVGELKVPGYSDYIHPLGENHLLTIGKDVSVVNGTAWLQGVQLSIFDVTDFAAPALVHRQLLGDRGTDSEALRNHKAFTYWPATGRLAIPLSLYEFTTAPVSPWDVGQLTFTGLQVFQVGVGPAEGFQPLGRIATSGSSWTRGLFMGERVFAVNPDSVRSVQATDFGAVEEVPLTP
jgi:inhibitor of cysteine peptidase